MLSTFSALQVQAATLKGALRHVIGAFTATATPKHPTGRFYSTLYNLISTSPVPRDANKCVSCLFPQAGSPCNWAIHKATHAGKPTDKQIGEKIQYSTMTVNQRYFSKPTTLHSVWRVPQLEPRLFSRLCQVPSAKCQPARVIDVMLGV